MKKYDVKKILKITLPLVLALISFFVLSKYASSAEFHAGTIASLDEKKVTVMELTAASTASSAAITLLPGDVATPIAEKLADISSCFLIVLCAIYLEKYLLTITGYATFAILIPLACVLFSASVFLKNTLFFRLAKKLAVFGIALVLVIPASVKISDLIEHTYESSIQETIDSAKESTEQMEDSAAQEEEEGFLDGVISKVKDGVSGTVEKVESSLNNFIEALAVMIVTSCVIPVVVLLFFFWLVKIFLGVDIQIPGRNGFRQ